MRRVTTVDCGDAAGSADADDCPGDGMSGADGDAEMRGADKCERAGGFGGESAERI